jgi:hypothetical protein
MHPQFVPLAGSYPPSPSFSRQVAEEVLTSFIKNASSVIYHLFIRNVAKLLALVFGMDSRGDICLV